MTGFGGGAADRGGLRAEVEIKGFNNRYLEVRLRLPPEVAVLEDELRRRVQGVAARGRVDASVQIVPAVPEAPRLEVRSSLVVEYLGAARALKRRHRLRGSLGVDQLLALPGVVQVVPGAPPAPGPASEAVREAFDAALEAFSAMRVAEGGRLASDLRVRLGDIEVSLKHLNADASQQPAIVAERLKERLAALTNAAGPDPARLAQEVALLADRVDVSEEIVRLRGYLTQARETLDRPEGPVGKTLDFVMQEMNREANTVSSKSEALPVCQAALKIRSIVESIREQVQNLE
jgi:uncharacterized protein (TIGR00255 family)